MIYKYFYKTPKDFDDILMNSDGEYLTGLWFCNSRDASKHIIDCEDKNLPIFKETIKWLDMYFSGIEPSFKPKYKIDNLTPFRREVIDIMNTIPFGETLTYNDISKIIAKRRNIKRMSSQAVGSNGSLTGYGGGIKNKVALLNNEKINMEKYFIPKTGTAL